MDAAKEGVLLLLPTVVPAVPALLLLLCVCGVSSAGHACE